MDSRKKNAAVISFTLAAGSVASPYYGQVNISQRLCKKTCVEEVPVFAPVFSFKSISNVGAGQYVVTVHVEGAITYNPCGSCGCCAEVQAVSQDFTIPVSSATEPTSVTIVQGVAVNAMNGAPCQKCSRNFVSETPLTITLATT